MPRYFARLITQLIFDCANQRRVQLCHHIAFLKFCLKYLAPHMMDTGFAPCLAYLNNNTVQYLIMMHFACQPLPFWQLYLRDLSTSNPYRVRLSHWEPPPSQNFSFVRLVLKQHSLTNQWRVDNNNKSGQQLIGQWRNLLRYLWHVFTTDSRHTTTTR